MSSTTTNVGIRLSLEGASQVQSGLAGVEKMAGGAARALAGIAAGSLSIAGLSAFVKGAIDAADETAKIAQKTGLATKEIAGLKLAFEQSGGAAEQFSPIMAKLGVAVTNGNKSLDAMGISARNSDGTLKSLRQVVGEVADKFAGYEDGTRKTALAVGLLGEEGAKMVPFLNQGSGALAEYDRIAKQLGLTLDTDTTKKAEQFNDTLDLIGKSTKGVATQVAAQLLPTLNTLAGEVLAVATDGQTLDKTVRALSGAFKGLYSIGVGVVEVFKTVGTAIGGVSAAVVAALSGDFSAAREIIKTMSGDISASWEAAAGSINRVWSEQGSATVDAINQITAASKALAPVNQSAASASKARAAADKEAAAALRDRVAAQVSANAAFDEEFKRIEDARLATEGRIQAGREMLESIQRETSMLGMSNVERQRAVALFELERAGVVKGTEAYAAYADAVSKAIGVQGARQAEVDAQKKLVEAQEKAVKDQEKAYADMWASVDQTAHDVFVSVADEGMDAFERIGKTLKAAILDMLYQMTVKKWIIQLSGGSLGGGTSGVGLGDISSAYSAFSTGLGGGAGAGAGTAGSASAIGSWAGGSMSTANMTGSVYANAAGTGMDGLLASNSAYGTASTTGTAGAAGASSWMTYAGYAALIVAAIKIAENLYSTGYNRTALGVSSDKVGANNSMGQYTYGRGNTTTGNGGSSSGIYRVSGENMNREFMDAIGMNEKWADIFSGTVRMATLFGRKLKGYGYQANIAGDEVDVKGYEYYKGGLFRSNKTITSEVNKQDADDLRAGIESVRESAKAMAQAMGYSSEAIDNYTGSLKINLKGVKNGDEAAQRYNEALEKLQRQMINSVTGLKMSEEAFKEFIEGITKDMEAVGISAAGIADIITNGMLGRISQAQVGEQLSDVVIGGIYSAIAGQYAGQIANVFTQQIIQPIFTAIAAGVPISQAISQAAISNVVSTAQRAAAALNAVFNDPSFRAAIAGVQQAIAGISVASGSVRAPSYKAAVSSYNAAAEAAKRAAEDTKRAWQDVADAMVDEIRRIRGELATDSGRGYDFYAAQFAVNTAKARSGDISAAEMLPELSQAMLEAAANTVSTLAELQRIRAYAAQSLQDTAATAAGRYGLKLPSFDVGTDFVPEDMVALIHKGERITPAPFNPMNSPEAGMSQLVERFDRMAERFDRMTTIMSAVEGNTDDTARVLKAVTYGTETVNT